MSTTAVGELNAIGELYVIGELYIEPFDQVNLLLSGDASVDPTKSTRVFYAANPDVLYAALRALYAIRYIDSAHLHRFGCTRISTRRHAYSDTLARDQTVSAHQQRLSRRTSSLCLDRSDYALAPCTRLGGICLDISA